MKILRQTIQKERFPMPKIGKNEGKTMKIVECIATLIQFFRVRSRKSHSFQFPDRKTYTWAKFMLIFFSSLHKIDPYTERGGPYIKNILSLISMDVKGKFQNRPL